MKTLAIILLTALTMLTASLNAAWEYNDVQDEMGRNAPEHHAKVISSRQDSFLKLARLSDGDTVVIFRVNGRIINRESGVPTEPQLPWAAINIRFDDRPIQSLELEVLTDLGLDNGMIKKNQTADFVNALRGAKILRMEVPIYGDGQVVYTFDVDGLIW